MATPAKRGSRRRTPRTPPTISAPKAAADPRPTRDEVAARAYQLFVRRGGAHGQDLEDWLLAERELAPDDARERRVADPPDYAG